MNYIFDNREISIGVWTFLFMVWVFVTIGKKSLLSLVKAFLVKPIIISFAAMILYIALIVTSFYRLGFWGVSDLKDTILWASGIAFVLLMNINDAHTDEHYFKNIILDNVKWVLILEFIINLYVFNLAIELLLIPTITFLVILKTVAETNPSLKPVNTLLNWLLGAAGIWMLAFAIHALTSDIQGFATTENLKDLLLPPVLTFAFLPFIYLAALYSEYEQVFVRLRIQNRDHKYVKYAIWRILLEFHFNFNKLNRWTKRIRSFNIRSKDDIAQMLRL